MELDSSFEANLSSYIKIRADFYLNLRSNAIFTKQMADAFGLMRETIPRNNKILIFGNGGSAAEAQHFAAELVCKFERDRVAMAAIALTTDTSILTAQSNDLGFDRIFSRQIEALGIRDDLAIGLTTSDCKPNSWHSRNILNGFLSAKSLGLKTIGLFSHRTKHLLNLVDVPIIVPSENTALIQEAHLFIIHRLCGLVEEYFSPQLMEIDNR